MSSQVRQCDIKAWATRADVVDLSHVSGKECNELYKEEGGFKQIEYSAGTYGCNGALVQGWKTGQFYTVVGRVPALWCVL